MFLCRSWGIASPNMRAGFLAAWSLILIVILPDHPAGATLQENEIFARNAQFIRHRLERRYGLQQVTYLLPAPYCLAQCHGTAVKILITLVFAARRKKLHCFGARWQRYSDDTYMLPAAYHTHRPYAGTGFSARVKDFVFEIKQG